MDYNESSLISCSFKAYLSVYKEGGSQLSMWAVFSDWIYELNEVSETTGSLANKGQY
jgi:hypothetical protein